jgi:hypothetical protein
MKTIFFLCFLFLFHFDESKLYAQKIDSLLGAYSIKQLRPDLNVYYDSIDNSDFCKAKVKELFYLRTKLFAKLDSTHEVLQNLKENNPGQIYYIERRREELFNFEGCFSRIKIKTWSHGLGRDVIDLELRIKEEGRFHNNIDGSSGWTIYREEIRKSPK